MNTKPLVSVIVPVFNVEAYLERCLDSIVAQTLKEIEIILVDDGSEDSSVSICNRYASADDRFRVIHKKNEGLSAARNTGIDEANANYLMFVDGDDWVEPRFCEIPFNIAREDGADLIMFGFRNFDEKRKRYIKSRNNFYEGKVEKHKAMKLIHSNMTQAVWSKLYKRSMFDEIHFPEEYVIEDFSTMYRLVHKANTIICSDAILYNYTVRRNGSLTATRSRKYAEDWVSIWKRKRQDLKEWGYDLSEYD